MLSCSYNGWTDFPEEEREALDAFEAAQALPAPAPISRIPLLPRVPPIRRAA
jgi:hypothetical protein